MTQLTLAERDLLIEAIIAFVRASDTWREKVEAATSPEFVTDLPKVEGSPREFAVAVVDHAERFGVYKVPPWIRALVEGVMPDTPDRATLLDKLPAEPPDPPADPLHDRWIRRHMPFLDRGGLRDALSQLLDPNGYAVLAVTGSKQCGKSYTAELVDHVALARDQLPDPNAAFDAARVSVDPRDAPMYTPELVAGRLVTAMGGGGPAPARHAETVRWVWELADWVFDARAKSGRRWCWLLDGFANCDLPDETRALVRELAARVSQMPYYRVARLVLLDYKEPLPGVPAPQVRAEPLGGPDSIGQVDVEECVDNLLARVSDEDTKPVRDKIVKRVLADLPAAEERLPELARRLEAEAQPIVARAAGG